MKKRYLCLPQDHYSICPYFLLGDLWLYFHSYICDHPKLSRCKVKNQESLFFHVDIQLTWHCLWKGPTSHPLLYKVSPCHKSIAHACLEFII